MLQYQLYLSQSHDACLNLAIEDWLLRAPQFSDHAILFFYVNDPAVVIGRAQNPWIECDLALAQQLNTLLVRRQSGGGTVYHDRGNLNFSFIVPKTDYDKAQHIDIIIDLLRRCDIVAHTNERYDILVKQHNIDYKVSGSAFREIKSRAFHHATLLFDADLNSLSPLLNPPDHGIVAKGVKSIRSDVINLQQVNPATSIADFLEVTEQTLQQSYQYISAQETVDNAAIQAAYRQYQTWDWIYGKTPPFVQYQTIKGKIIKKDVVQGLVDDQPFVL